MYEKWPYEICENLPKLPRNQRWELEMCNVKTFFIIGKKLCYQLVIFHLNPDVFADPSLSFPFLFLHALILFICRPVAIALPLVYKKPRCESANAIQRKTGASKKSGQWLILAPH